MDALGPAAGLRDVSFMADIDDELLALAGGDSEDDGSGSSPRDASASPAAALRDAGKTPSKKRWPASHNSEEEGEASSAHSSPNSLQSAPMDESDSEAVQPSREPAAAAVPAADGDDKYPVDGMFMSQAEKAEIIAMREVEREQIIADRISEIERQRQNRLLRQMVTSVENEEHKHVNKKRSADSVELEDGERKASRPRTGKASETAMDSLRRARAEKQRRKEVQECRKDSFSPRRELGGPGSDDDDFERARSRMPPAELRDYERVRLGRNEFAQVCFTPGFEAAISGCFMRISVGTHPETGIEQYRMVVIKGFTKGRPYSLTGPNGQFVTDQYVKSAHGKAAREFPFIAASSGKFTDSELNRYQVTCHNETVGLPTKQSLLDKIDDINGLIGHKWTREEIKAQVARRNELKRRFDPAERERVARLLDEAVARGDEQKAEELQEELDKLGSQRLAFRTTLGPAKRAEGTSSEQDRLAERNRENRRMNAELVRKAQLKKAKSREIEMAMRRGEQVPDDPSRRLRTKAKFVYDVNEPAHKAAGRGSGASTPTNGTPKASAAKPAMAAHLVKLQEKKYEDSKGVPTIHKPLVDDDVIGTLDLEIDVEI